MTKQSRRHSDTDSGIDRAKLFAVALIETNGNATEAARRVFKLGSKGGKKHQRTAESMGSEYLRKPEIQKHLSELLDAAAMNRSWVLLRLKQLAEQTRDPHLALKSITLVARILRLLPEDQPTPGDHARAEPRKAILMLSPPSLPLGGKPTPALEKQWKEMGWTPDWKPAYQVTSEN